MVSDQHGQGAQGALRIQSYKDGIEWMADFCHMANTIPECIIIIVTVGQHNFIAMRGNLFYTQELLKIIRVNDLFIKWLFAMINGFVIVAYTRNF